VRALLLALVVTGLPADAADRAGLDQRLKAEYRGRILILRHFYTDEDLKYDKRGELLVGGPAGPWTLWGKVRISDTKVTGDSILLKGERLLLVYDAVHKEFRDLFSFDPAVENLGAWFANYDLHTPGMRELAQKRLVRIEIDVKGLNESESLATLRKVFLAEWEDVGSDLPSYWRQVAKPGKLAVASATGDAEEGHDEDVWDVGGDVSPPRLQYAPDPEYSQPARAAGLQGSLTLSLVVTPAGKPADTRIVNPVGMGLDEKAVETVSTWEFTPARKDGRPVAVRVNVQVNFKLY
jgi:TonB family protein